MRFAFTNDQLLFRDAVRDMLRKECTASTVRACWHSNAEPFTGLWQALAKMGIVGMTAAESVGGLAMNELDCVLVFEELGRAAVPDGVIEHVAIALPLLAELGDRATRDRWLAPAVCGNLRLAARLSDADLVVNVDGAAVILVHHQGALYAVSREQARLVPQPSVDGSRNLARLDLCPDSSQPVATGDSVAIAVGRARARATLAIAAQLLGLAQHMIDMTVEYCKTRQQFGRPIGSFQAIKHKLVDAHMKLEFARPVVYRAAHSLSHEDSAALSHVAMAKAFASDAAKLSARHALQCHGAIGYSYEHDLHLWMKRSWALAASYGDAAFHRGQVAAWLLDRPNLEKPNA